MNLLGRQLAVGAAIVLIIGGLGSCEDPGDIGLLVDADNGVVKPYYVDVTLPTSVVQFNPRSSKFTRTIQVGMFNNPDFGTIVSKTFVEFSFGTVLEVSDSAEFKSLDLNISFTSFIGDTPLNDEVQQVKIYQLAQGIDKEVDYTRLDELPLQNTPLGEWNFTPKVNDTIQFDSTYIVTLNEDIGLDLFKKLQAGDPIFDSNDAFNNYFKGIALVPGGNNRAIFYFDPPGATLRLNYVEFNSDGEPIDRYLEFNVGGGSFYHISADYSGTALAGIQPDNTDYYPTDDYRYLQFGTLVAIRADLTPYYLLLDTLDAVVINRADIYIGGIINYNDDTQPPEYLQIYFTDETNNWPIIDDIGRIDTSQVGRDFVMLQDENDFPVPGIYSRPQRAYYDVDNNNYQFSLSWFLQNIRAGNFHDPSQPFLEEKGQIFIFGQSSVIVPQRSPAQSTVSPLRFPKDSIRFRIYYTIPNTEDR